MRLVTPLNCIEILQQYGLDREEISLRTGLSVKVIENIHKRYYPGHKHLPVLQQALAQYEQSLNSKLQSTGTDDAVPVRVEPNDDTIDSIKAMGITISAVYAVGTEQFQLQRRLSDLMLEQDNRDPPDTS